MAYVARTSQLRRTRHSVPVPVKDPVTLVVRDIQQNILDMQKQYECPICLELITEPRATDCGHYFCKDCILQYISLTSKKPPIKCPLCKETVTKRSLVECSNMGDISRAIRQLAEGYHLDTGTTISTPYVRNIVDSKTNENTAMVSSTPRKKTQIGTKQEEKIGGDKIETLECDKSEVKPNNTETETNKDLGAKSEQPDTSLESKIQGSAMRSRSLNGTNFSGFGDAKCAKVNKNKKQEFSKIISDILGISGTCSFDQSNASAASFRCVTSIPHNGTNHNSELKTGTNMLDMTPAFVNAKGFEFASSKSLFENKTNSIDNHKSSNLELSEDEYRSKRLKSGTETISMVSFAPGICQLGALSDRNNLETGTDTNNWFSNDTSLLSIASDIHSATTESLSGITDFSPIKYPSNHNFSKNFYPSPKLELTSRRIGTNFSSTLLANTETEEYFYEGNILEMTFSDNSQSNHGNSQNETNSIGNGTETNYEEEIALPQHSFNAENTESVQLSQIPEMGLEQTLQYEISYHSINTTLKRDVSILEPSYLSGNTIKFHDEPSIEPFSIETSKDFLSVNQTKFEMELKELISETETLDSVIFTQPYITDFSLPNHIAPEDTETPYTLIDIFSPIQQNTSSPKLSHSQSSNLSTNDIGIGKQTLLNLANESLENFNSQPEAPFASQNKEELLCAPMVAMVVINSQQEKDESLNFSRFSQLIQTGNDTLRGSNSFSHRVSDSYMEDTPFMEVRN